MLSSSEQHFDDAFIAHANTQLGGSHAASGAVADWLTGDEILHLVSLNNPDNVETGASWLSGPAPMNFWRTHFERTLVTEHEHGRVHMMVVNTMNAYTLTAEASGAHWFVAAWFIEPASD